MPAFGVVVHDVVVNQREVVDQLHRHRPGERHRGRSAHRLGRQDGQGGPDPFTVTPRRQGLPVGVNPAEVVAGRGGQPGRKPVDGRPQSRLDQGAGPLQHIGDAVFAGHATEGALAPVANPAANRPALTPLRTAPSMVAGQPVSHHAPARNTPGMAHSGPTRRRWVPGAP